MSYLKFDKAQLVNLEYSLKKELVRSNRAGSFASTTIINCNTRKYHGLLICPIDSLGNENHILLSSLDETIVQRNEEFHLGIHKYPGEYYPRGHKYIRKYEIEPTPALTYRVGGVILKKELLLVEEEERILLRYTLIDAHSPTIIRFQPFLAFRNIHNLTHCNLDANTKFRNVSNGIKIKLYDGFPYLFMQTSKKSEFIPMPDWNLNIQYIEEIKRGYANQEDLYVPGYFELAIKKGESVVFAAGTKEAVTSSLNRQFNSEIKKRVPRDSFENCLENAAQQFISKKANSTKIIAGFPWFGHWARDTFISLPGLTLARGETQTFFDVIDTALVSVKKCFFESEGNKINPGKDSADPPLWFFWALQKFVEVHGNAADIWQFYGDKLKNILECYKSGTDFNIKMHENGLLWVGMEGLALTWMDVAIQGKPVTPRTGYPVEINALWYNAICFAIELANEANDQTFLSDWKNLPELIRNSFVKSFWSDEKKYLADYIDDKNKNWSLRPNQLFAVSMPYSCLDEEKQKAVLDVIEKELLTSKGLRTLSPQDPDYKGVYEGNEIERNLSYHQGSVRPWLFGHFAEAYLNLYQKAGVPLIRKLYDGYEDCMNQHGIGSISEIYDGNPPYRPNGATSYALSVSELIRVNYMLKQFD